MREDRLLAQSRINSHERDIPLLMDGKIMPLNNHVLLLFAHDLSKSFTRHDSHVFHLSA
jgi:hypothetical protein